MKARQIEGDYDNVWVHVWWTLPLSWYKEFEILHFNNSVILNFFHLCFRSVVVITSA